MRSIVLFAVLNVCVFSGCARKRLVTSDLSAYIADESNGLRKRQDWHGFTMLMEYVPAPLANRILGGTSTTSPHNMVYADMSQYLCFSLTLSHKSGPVIDTSQNAKYREAALKYLENEIGNDLHLWEGVLSHDVTNFIYLGTNGSEDGSSVLMFFKNVLKSDQKDVKVVFEDHFFGTGANIFPFSTRDITLINNHASED